MSKNRVIVEAVLAGQSHGAVALQYGISKVWVGKLVARWRLGWSLVEWRRPTSGGSSDAQEMARFFDSASHLDQVVLVIDEVEEFAASRSELTPGAATSGTNELLKALTKFRSRAGRLLVASTNHVSRLDPAVLRRLVLAVQPQPSASDDSADHPAAQPQVRSQPTRQWIDDMDESRH